ncbi:MAG: hypothetical protein AB1420_10135 [Bacillota bacterium]
MRHRYIIAALLIIGLSVFYFACSSSDNGRKEVTNKIPVSTGEKNPQGIEDLIQKGADDKNEAPLPDDKTVNPKYTTPKGAYVLGKYSSPNEMNSIIIWEWYDTSAKILMGDFVYWNWSSSQNEKILTAPLLESRARRVAAKWLDDHKVLLNGFYVFDINTKELNMLLPNEPLKILDYEMNHESSLVALIVEDSDALKIWITDADTLHNEEVHAFSKDYYDGRNSLRVNWGINNSIFFDAFEKGEAVVYKYNLEHAELSMVQEKARLVGVDRDLGVATFARLDNDSGQSLITEKIHDEKRLEMLEVTEEFLHKLGYQVGNEPGKLTLIVDRVFGNKAVILYGFWSSEFLGEIVLKKENDSWKVDFERQRYYLPYHERFHSAVDYLVQKENLNIGDEPGKHIVGSPYWNEQLVVLLVGEYGYPWQWEYYVVKKEDGWKIQKTLTLEGELGQWWLPTSPTKALIRFLEGIIKGDYATAYKKLHFEGKALTLDEFKEAVSAAQVDITLIDFDLGENRVLKNGEKASVQVWLIGEDGNEEVLFYHRWPCINTGGSWKLVWPLEFFTQGLE